MTGSNDRQERIQRIRALPDDLEGTITGLSEEQLVTCYIEGEWTIRQIVHHIADAHMNAMVRMKLILTEDQPYLKGYQQDDVAILADVDSTSIDASLMIIRGLHNRWANLFERLEEDDWGRIGLHDGERPLSIERMLITYADHGGWHLDQIREVVAASK